MRMHAAKRLGRRSARRVLDGGGAHPALEALLRDAARLPDGPLPGEQTALMHFRSRRLVAGWSPTPAPVRTPRRSRRPALGLATVLAAGVATTLAIGAIALVSGTGTEPGPSGRQEPAGALAAPTTTTSSGTRAPSTTSSSDAPRQTPHRSISPSQLVELVQPCTTFLVALQEAKAGATATTVGPSAQDHTGADINDGDHNHWWDGHRRNAHHSPVHRPANPAPPTPQAPPVLVEAAGGADKVPAFCAALVTTSPSQPATTPSPTTPSSVPSSSMSGTSSPTSTRTGYSITSDLGEPPG
jgi:hypothetical protein